MTYYLERRDPNFLLKMKEVLLVYQEVALQNEAASNGAPHPLVITVSVDEKPGVQAIGNTAPDLPPVAGKHSTVARDHEYIRSGTWSILAALDLHDGHVTARVEEWHRSVEFVALLQDLDAYYPPESTIRLILDNHSVHISKETRAYLATRPNRFKYVLTPTHGSWLNIVETLFGKATRTFLRQIRVGSKQELKERILLATYCYRMSSSGGNSPSSSRYRQRQRQGAGCRTARGLISALMGPVPHSGLWDDKCPGM